MYSNRDSIYRLYLRDAIIDWKTRTGIGLCSYNVTIDAVFNYLLYVIDYVRDIGIVIPNAVEEARLHEYIVKDFLDYDDSYDKNDISVINDIAERVVRTTAAMYEAIRYDIAWVIQQPKQQFILNVACYDDNYLYLGFIPQQPRSFSL
jgi:hypothetical protein